MEENEPFFLKREEYLEPDEDLKRAISAEELLKRVEEDIHEMFKSKKRKAQEK